MNKSTIGRATARCFASLLLVTSLSTVAQAQPKPAGTIPAGERVALVIGNAAYKQSPLPNPVNDATDMAAALQAAGFRVIMRRNANQREMRQAIREFGTVLRRDQVGLFYFAGHGVQVRGVNYLIPVDANIKTEADVEDEAIDANFALRTMEEAQAKVSILVLDACRDNPYARTFRSTSRGLAQMQAATGSLIAFATSPGTQAADGSGRNGVYTKHLLASLQEPDTDVLKVFQRTRAAVVRETGGKQTPWESTSLIGDFHFRAPLQAPVAAAAPSQDAEFVFWNSIQNSRDPNELNAYLTQYPNGRFATLARARLKSIETTKAPPAQVAISGRASAPTTAVPPTAPPMPRPVAPLLESLQSMPAGTVFRECEGCPEMVVIPPGRFMMGSHTSETGRDNDEGPQREVTIPRAIAVGKFEVTRGQFERFAQEEKRLAMSGCDHLDPGFAQTDDHPVVCVDWNDARAYAAWLSRKTGKTYRLLSESEWEYAARAKTTTAFFWGASFEPAGCRHANIADGAAKCADGHAHTAPAGRFLANAFGLHDMLGNAWEWVEDCGKESYHGAPNEGLAWTSGDCSQRVLRGGSWGGRPRSARAADRIRFGPTVRTDVAGLRVARSD